MTFESDIRDALIEQSVNVTSNVTFESVWNAVTNEAPRRGIFISKKRTRIASIAALASIIPIAGAVYAATTVFHWGGASFQQEQNVTGPMSQLAEKSVLNSMINQKGSKILDLASSRAVASFSIYQPVSTIQGWTKTLGEGIISPLLHYHVNSNGTKTFTGTTQQPVEYIDVYSNLRGQTVSVSQSYDDAMTKAWQSSIHTTNNWSGSVTWGLGKDVVDIGSFDGGYAFAIQGNWSEIPSVHKSGEFTNLVILHPDKNNVVSDVVLDESGGVTLQTLEKIASEYLNGTSS
ncbi:hypothetical protein [Alicyclobacillus fastidiosus]|uniref:DUF4367 domain-containing protein n=2 Tax=Alicyclobacillus fastidiosus TaxID=392011 RepID=A0ABV5ALV9_9BACL